LEARVPRSKCPEHGLLSVAVPWAREGSGFTLLEALVMLLCGERDELVKAFRLPERYLAVQLSSRERARNICSSLWAKILAPLLANFSIVLLGLADEVDPDRKATANL
jgi:hypothetical protein